MELEILKKEADYYFNGDISTRLRSRKAVTNRAAFYAVALKLKHKWNVSLQEIGEMVDRDHATVLHYQKTSYVYEKDERFNEAVKYLFFIITRIKTKKNQFNHNPKDRMIEHLDNTLDIVRRKNKRLISLIGKDDYSLDEMFLGVPVDRKKEFIKNQATAFLRMEKTRVTYQDLKA